MDINEFNYTEDQIKSINTIDNNLQIIACAGSGKTQVISQRIVNILNKKTDVKPENIVAFTYTEKAAAELKSRIFQLHREQIGNSLGLADIYVGTIHAWCLEILQDLIYEYQKFNVLEEITLKLFIDKYFKQTGMAELNMERYKDTNFFISMMTMLRESELNYNYKMPKNLQEALNKYEKCLFDHSYFDFTMIMTKCLEHIKDNKEFKKKLKNKIKYLTVDEYQDVNPIQEKIINEIYNLGVNICVVGDDDQTIYQWRGSDISNILNFRKKYKNIEYIKLEDNFRSSNAIVDTAVNIINNNQKRLDKIMKANSHQVYEKGDILLNSFENTDEEFRFIVNTINNLRGVKFKDKKDGIERGIDYSDFAILLRRWRKGEDLIEYLINANIPFIIAGINNLFNQPEITASLNIFNYLAKLIDKELLISSWTGLSGKIKKSAVQTAVEYLNKKNPEKYNYYESFVLQDIFYNFLETAGIKEELFSNGNEIAGNTTSEIIFYNLGMFSQIIDDFEIIHFMDNAKFKLTGFLNFIRYNAQNDYPEGWLNNAYKTPNAVQIMTIYQAKGLEFPVVFVPGLNKNYLPTQRFGGKSVWHFLDKDLIKGVERYEFSSEEDERRLMYVAVTRAQKFLIVTRAPDGRNQQQKSIFCKEIRKSDYPFSSSNRNYSERKKIEPSPKPFSSTIELNFSVLKSFFDCPYSFKFYCMYGFQNPLSARIGYGRSIHNVLMEIHRNYLDGKETNEKDIPVLLDTHLHFPYALDEVKNDMRTAAGKNVSIYLNENKDEFKNIEFAEKKIKLILEME